MKRFYQVVTSCAHVDGGYEIHLDGQPVKTSKKNILRAPNKAVADHVVQEWADQPEEIRPDEMPFTQFLSTCCDTSAEERADITAQVMRYLDTDLLCYRTTNPEDIARKQCDAWDPLLDIYLKRYDQNINTTTSIAAIKQEDTVHAFMQTEIAKLDDVRFTVLQVLTSLSGSLLLAFLFVQKEIDPDTLFHAAYVEEIHKDTLYDAEKYGKDPHLEKKQTAMQRELQAASKILLSS